tara:strand:+ start:178 stop:1038 length:861 start_codon:yes stop_codon:yes gene_type:complete
MKLNNNDIRTKEVLDWKGLHLLHFRTSACSQKTRIFLNLKNISWKSKSINLVSNENYSDWFLGINPRAQVPVLIDDGDVHIESNDIIQHLEKKFPQPNLIPLKFESDISNLLKEEDDLHIDLRNISFRFLFGNNLRKKSNKLINKLRDDKGTILEKEDIHKNKILSFYKNLNKNNGITNDSIKSSVLKFKKEYDAFENKLHKHEYLLGDDLSILDIAWFIYTHRLYLSGYPFDRLHPHVYSWYKKLIIKKEFKYEVKEPMILKIIRTITKIKDSFGSSSLSKIAGI